MNYNKNCSTCNYYKKNMCICTKPKIQNKPFGFPFKFQPQDIKECNSWEKENIDKWALWEHM